MKRATNPSINLTREGVLDDVRIYSKALGANEIGELYSEGGWIKPPD
jgi:hypothetical protein